MKWISDDIRANQDEALELAVNHIEKHLEYVQVNRQYVGLKSLCYFKRGAENLKIRPAVSQHTKRMLKRASWLYRHTQSSSEVHSRAHEVLTVFGVAPKIRTAVHFAPAIQVHVPASLLPADLVEHSCRFLADAEIVKHCVYGDASPERWVPREDVEAMFQQQHRTAGGPKKKPPLSSNWRTLLTIAKAIYVWKRFIEN